jgi:hypothetical protein
MIDDWDFRQEFSRAERPRVCRLGCEKGVCLTDAERLFSGLPTIHPAGV